MKKVFLPCLAAMAFALAAVMPMPGGAADLKIDKEKFCGKRS